MSRFGGNRANDVVMPLLATVAAVLLVVLVLAVLIPQVIKAEKLDFGRAPYSESSFALVAHSADINPGAEYVLYTNYACPYCAGFYNETKGIGYTTRLLLRDTTSERFDSQGLVSAYMLALYRENRETFASVEDWLFNNQESWVFLDQSALLGLLNERSGLKWDESDLSSCYLELEEVARDAPEDLEFVPALYADGRCYNEYMLGLFGK